MECALLGAGGPVPCWARFGVFGGVWFAWSRLVLALPCGGAGVGPWWYVENYTVDASICSCMLPFWGGVWL